MVLSVAYTAAGEVLVQSLLPRRGEVLCGRLRTLVEQARGCRLSCLIAANDAWGRVNCFLVVVRNSSPLLPRERCH